jgi:glutaredoxin
VWAALCVYTATLAAQTARALAALALLAARLSTVTEVILYSRPGCHLCDDARAVLEAEQIAFEEIDIDRSDELLKRYLVRIPVISIDGEEVFEFFVDRSSLRERIASAGTGPGANRR